MIAPARTFPDQRDGVRLLVVDPLSANMSVTAFKSLGEHLRPGDLVVLNDAATVPAALVGQTAAGAPVEARLVAALGARRFHAVLFGTGSWRDRTEDRPPPPPVRRGDELRLGALTARVLRVSDLSSRLVELEFTGDDDTVWSKLYESGRPVQYSYLNHELPLWAVQNVYASRPWAFEMPSAGRPLTWEVLLGLKQRGVSWAFVTHAAGLSATGDPALDEALPLPEKYDVPSRTADKVRRTREEGNRVVAVGTTVVRALESAAAPNGELRAGAGETSLKLGPEHRPRVVDGLLCGIHVAGESHFELLQAFGTRELFDRAERRARDEGLRSHEFGDAMLLLAA